MPLRRCVCRCREPCAAFDLVSTSIGIFAGAGGWASTQQRRWSANTYNFTSYTGSERKKLSSRWENAFYGKVFYEAGMRERYNSALEDEAQMDQDIRDQKTPTSSSAAGRGGGAGGDGNSEGDDDAAALNADPTRRTAGSSDGVEPLLPPLEPDACDTPIEVLRQHPPAAVKAYIVSCLTRGERRIMYAADFGSLTMMQHLHHGEQLLTEAETLLNEFGYMNDALRIKIETVRDSAAKTKFDLDLD